MAEPRNPWTLLWGLGFGLVAALGLWTATGHSMDASRVDEMLPYALIALGLAMALSLALSRRHRR